MSDPLHIIVTLSPETIEALAAAMRRRAAFVGTSAPAAVLYHRQPYAKESTPITEADVGRVAASLADVTPRGVLEALGVPPERMDRAASTRVGIALHRLGYRVVSERYEGGERRRVYQRTDPC